MALDQGTVTVAVTSQERTWRVSIETPRGVDPTIKVFREEVKTDANGIVISKTVGVRVSRGLSVTAAQSFTVAGKTYTTAEIAVVIAAIADAWRTEDIAAAAAKVTAAKVTAAAAAAAAPVSSAA
jgi:hypothetical protein